MALPNRLVPTPQQIAEAEAVLESQISDRKQKMDEVDKPSAPEVSQEKP